MSNDETIRTTILAMATARGADKTICPSEVARAIAGNDEKQWRLLMKPVKRNAIALSREDAVILKRKGKPVAAEDLRGVYRIGIASEGGRDTQGDGST